MRKIVGISFSPRKLGNSEIAIKEICNNFPEKVEFEFLNIYKFKILPCVACYRCLFGDGTCKLDDDFELILKKIIEADGLIFAVPTYFLGPNSSFKLFIDRFLLSYKYYEKIDGKPVILITIAGLENGGEGYTDLALKSSARVVGLNVVGSAILYAALPGEVVLKEENLNILKQLAKSFFEEINENEENTLKCNICGSNYFEFLNNGFVKCLVCKNRGKLVMEEDGEFSVYIEKGDLFFGSKEAKLRHKEWLKNMKNRFISQREKLKEIAKKYK